MANWICSGSNGSWTEYRHPFAHIHATDVFPLETYERLSEGFASVVEHTFTGAANVPKMTKTNPNYDALVLGMSAPFCDHFAPIFTCESKDVVAQLFNLPLTTRVDGALHHVPRGSRSGWLHTDLCSGWFPCAPQPDVDQELVFPDRSQCDYFSGASRKQGVQVEEYVRAASMIYYLNNDGWVEGDGGETELYSTSRSNIGPRKTIVPRNNTLILFECTPHSFHRLLANPGRQRNSIVVWFHTTLEFAQSRWGEAISRKNSS